LEITYTIGGRIMKILIMLAIITISVNYKGDFCQNKLFNDEIIDYGYKIKKSDLSGVNTKELKGFKSKFIHSGEKLSRNNVAASIIEGVRNDTLFKIVLFSKSCKFNMMKIIPVSTLKRVEKGYFEDEYILAYVFLDLNKFNNCINLIILKNKPFKVDTLKNKFNYFHDIKSIIKIDTLKFCD
jgi:hypothetical protein